MNERLMRFSITCLISEIPTVPRTFIFLILFGLSSVYANAEEEREKPDIVLILADDPGYGDLGCFGQLENSVTRTERSGPIRRVCQ